FRPVFSRKALTLRPIRALRSSCISPIVWVSSLCDNSTCGDSIYGDMSMSWWAMITTKGRLLPNVGLSFIQDEIRIFCPGLEEDEKLAILIDQFRNKARIYAPFEECRRLAALHRYELSIPRHEEETLASDVERVLAVIHDPGLKPGL